MVYFSFSLLDDTFNNTAKQLKPNKTYYSKDLTLWKELNNKKKSIGLNFINREKRKQIKSLGKKILICLPPNFGTGDAVEYCISIKSLIKSRNFSKVGIAFLSKHYFIFKNLFSFNNLYPLVISSDEINSYDTVFHITLEINALKFQKLKRSNIALEICNYFNIKLNKYQLKKTNFKKNKSNKISIFPISTSVIRSLPVKVVNEIILNFKEKYDIEIFIDNSDYSKHFLNEIYSNEIIVKNPTNIENLTKNISKIEFGIFVDSGPLHLAKLFDKSGILIETSVSKNILLKDSQKIRAVRNIYKSNYCSGPCGLVDLFSFNQKVGCYEIHKSAFDIIKNVKDPKKTHRWEKKENNLYFMQNPVGCVKEINVDNVLKMINYKLKEI